MSDPAEQRAETIAAFREIAARVFAEQPHVRSLLLALGQYRDEDYQPEPVIHVRVVASVRDVPVWPHTCAWYETSSSGEACDHCGDVGAPEAAADAWTAYTREHRGDFDDFMEIFEPYAVARRGGPAGVVVDVVGKLQRGIAVAHEAGGGEVWQTPRARELFAEVIAAPDDDGPRAVLADHLLEARDPRGEAIALALAPHLDPAAAERRDDLVARNARAWIRPLGRVIPPGGARFARGFLAAADVYALDRDDAAAVAGAPAWGTVEAIRFLPGGLDFVDPAMTALRDVGIVRRGALEAIADAERPWRIERMHAMFEEAQTARWSSYGPSLELIARIATLPRLRFLALGFDAPDKPWLVEEAVPRLPAAPWWPHLRALALVLAVPSALANWREHHRRLGIPWLAIAHAGPHGEPAGWQVAFGPHDAVEITLAGWHARATLANLAALVSGLPAGLPLRLVSTPLRMFTHDDVATLADLARRPFLVG
ncbi:MAG: hypothetical protein KIT31_37620 [Deltaproteobacteria bacterium]|nr:hypothetical protein [Deltaproteobacteria bacterium]